MWTRRKPVVTWMAALGATTDTEAGVVGAGAGAGVEADSLLK